MIISDVAMLVTESNRTRLYLQQMVKHQLLPAMVLLMESSTQKTPEAIAVERINRRQHIFISQGEDFDLTLSVRDYLGLNNIPYQILPSQNPNSVEVIHAVADCKSSILIYSGPGGAILHAEILSTGKQFLHIHPGYLPDFRGSTTIYYSLIKENLCGASAFFLTDKIDAGPIIRREVYPPPADRITIDIWYDPFIRSDLLIKVLKDFIKTGKFETQPQPKNAGEVYFIIHPVLKHIAILSN